MFFLGKSDGGLNIYSSFRKIVIIGIKVVSERLVIVTLLSVKVLGIVWIELFRNIFLFSSIYF